MTIKKHLRNNKKTLDKQKYSNISFLKNHPAIFISILYLISSCFGLIYYYSLFSNFNINIFDYVESNDFLFASFKEIEIILIVSLFLMVILLILYQTSKKEITTQQSKGIYFLFTIILFAFIPAVAGDITATKLEFSNENIVSLAIKIGNIPKQTFVNQKIIGNTEQYSFYYDLSKKKVRVVPISSILFIEYQDSIIIKRDTSKLELPPGKPSGR